MDLELSYKLISGMGMGLTVGTFAVYFVEKYRKKIREEKETVLKGREQIIQEHYKDINRIALYLISNELKKPELPEVFGYSSVNFPVAESTLALERKMRKDKSLELRVKEEIETGKAKIRAFVDREKPSIDVEYEIVY